jgi:hemerythrin-like domain-containing protein
VVQWAIDPKKEESNMSQPSGPNIAADLIRIHRVITRGLEVSIQHSRAPLAAATAAGFITYVRTLSWVLHGHHVGEDQAAFPFLRQKQIDAPYLLLVAEHGAMQAILDEVAPALDRLAAKPGDRKSLAFVHQALNRLTGIWHPHIQREETHLTEEVIAAAIGVKEQLSLVIGLAEYARQSSGPDYLAVPFVLYNLSPEDRAGMIRVMPPEITQHLVPVVWRDQWAPMKSFLLDVD